MLWCLYLRARVSYSKLPGPSSVELSSLLVRNVTYEIPSLKKQIAKCQQLQQEYSRKEEEGQAGAAEMREQFYHSCKQYGITVSGCAITVGESLGPAARVQLAGFPLNWTMPIPSHWLTFLQPFNVFFDWMIPTSPWV